ncbi:hypothetical protein AB5V95_02490 [Metamycoplasma spumans]|uniref:hypothetical protein n=1 Tax=Metamycoplasma spumans TaxID=92406 RepID=UPI000483F4C1
MRIKYKLVSTIDNIKEDIPLETQFVPYIERVEGKFICIDFKDENTFECNLKASEDEVFVSYASQSLHMIKNQRVTNSLKITEDKSLNIDFYLKEVKITSNEISINYDLLQGDNIIVKNKAIWIIE